MSYVLSPLDPGQVLKAAAEDSTGTLMTIDGFVLGKIGRKIEITYPTSSSEIYTYLENGTTLFVVTVTYTDSTKEDIQSVERTA